MIHIVHYTTYTLKKEAKLLLSANNSQSIKIRLSFIIIGYWKIDFNLAHNCKFNMNRVNPCKKFVDNNARLSKNITYF